MKKLRNNLILKILVVTACTLILRKFAFCYTAQLCVSCNSDNGNR